MAQSKKYLVEMACHMKEDFDGERWIDEAEFKKIKQRAVEGDIQMECSECNIKIKDAEGNVIFDYCGMIGGNS